MSADHVSEVKRKLIAALELVHIENEHLDMSLFLSNFLDLLDKVIGTQAGSILVKNKHENSIKVVIASGPKAREAKAIKVDYGRGISGWVMQNQKAILVNDVSQDERFDQSISDLLEFPTVNLLCVPIYREKNIVGVLELINKVSGPFSEEDQQFLEELAQYLGHILHNHFLS